MKNPIDRASERPTLLGTLTALTRYRALLRNLVMKDLKLKYRGSVLGFMWSLVNPLVMIAVYSVAFTFILGSKVEGFVFFLLLGILPWGFFANATLMSTVSIFDNGSLLRSIRFPLAILPTATVLFNLAQYLLTIAVFLPIMFVVRGVPLAGSMLLFPIILALQVLFTLGLALLVSAGTVFYRDIRHVVEIAMPILFWLTPIVYPLTQVPEGWRHLVLCSPVSPFIVAYQQIFFARTWPSAEVWAAAGIYGLGGFLVGITAFLAVEDRLAEQL